MSKKTEKSSLKTFIGVLLGFAGLLLLINPFNLNTETNFNIPGITVVLFASLSWAFGSVYTKNAVQPVSKVRSISMQMLAGGFLLTLVSLLTGEWGEINWQGISLKYSQHYCTLFSSDQLSDFLHTSGSLVLPVTSCFGLGSTDSPLQTRQENL